MIVTKEPEVRKGVIKDAEFSYHYRLKNKIKINKSYNIKRKSIILKAGLKEKHFAVLFG